MVPYHMFHMFFFLVWPRNKHSPDVKTPLAIIPYSYLPVSSGCSLIILAKVGQKCHNFLLPFKSSAIFVPSSFKVNNFLFCAITHPDWLIRKYRFLIGRNEHHRQNTQKALSHWSKGTSRDRDVTDMNYTDPTRVCSI